MVSVFETTAYLDRISSINALFVKIHSISPIRGSIVLHIFVRIGIIIMENAGNVLKILHFNQVDVLTNSAHNSKTQIHSCLSVFHACQDIFHIYNTAFHKNVRNSSTYL